MPLNLRQLEVFHAIIKHGSVTGAARGLHVTQPAVSAVLKHMEQRLGFPLFERVGGRLKPTPEAEALLPDVQEIFGRLDTLNRFTQDMRDGLSGGLVVASSPTLVDSLLPQAIARFRKGQPGISVSLRSLPTPLAVERVARREVDMGLVYGPIDDAGVNAEDLLVSEIACALPPSHPMAVKRQVRAVDLVGEPVISLSPSTALGQALEAQCRKQGVPPPVAGIEPSSSLTACLLVREGAGIALVDRTAALSSSFEDLVFKTFVPRIPVTIQMIFPRERPRSRASQLLVLALRDILRVGKRPLGARRPRA